MQSLRSGLDELRVERALGEGLITAGQAANALKFIRAAKAVRANPIRARPVQVGAQFMGEIEFDGVAWVGRRYGQNYLGGATFASEAEAYAFVCGAD